MDVIQNYLNRDVGWMCVISILLILAVWLPFALWIERREKKKRIIRIVRKY